MCLRLQSHSEIDISIGFIFGFYVVRFEKEVKAMTIAERIKIVQEREGIRTAELARRSGLSDATLRTIQRRNSATLRTDTLERIATGLNVSAAYLRGDTDKKQKNADFDPQLLKKRLRECMKELRAAFDPAKEHNKQLRPDISVLYEFALEDPDMLTAADVIRLADAFEVSPFWLVGAADQKHSDRDPQELARTNDAEIDAKMAELRKMVLSLVSDTRELSYPQELSDRQQIPARIDTIMDFLRNNKTLLYHNMPGIPTGLEPPKDL